MTHFEIKLGKHGRDCRIVKDGVDISNELSGFEVSALVDRPTKVVLHYPAVEGVVGRVEVEDDTVEVTP